LVTVEPKHLALWARAHDVTKPGKTEQRPNYGAWHRQRAERRQLPEIEPEADPEEVEGLTVTP
jgi:hypothetical protein